MRAATFLAALSLALTGSCAAPAAPTPPPALVPAEPQLARGQARVEGVREIGPYLEASLVGRGGRQGFLFVASDACRSVLNEGAVVRVEPASPLVRVRRADGVQCAAQGLAQLAAWRDALPERRASFLVVTQPAELRLVAEAHGFLLAAGKLPLAAELRWTTPLDVAAVLPDTPACRTHLARPRTELEFRPRGDDVLVLRGRLEPCPVLAIAEPVFLD